MDTSYILQPSLARPSSSIFRKYLHNFRAKEEEEEEREKEEEEEERERAISVSIFHFLNFS